MLRSRAPLIFALLSVFLAARCSSPESATTPRIVVIGLDGADWEQIDVLLKEDRLPHMKSLQETGTMVFIVWETTFSNQRGRVVAEVQESFARRE